MASLIATVADLVLMAWLAIALAGAIVMAWSGNTHGAPPSGTARHSSRRKA